MYGFRNIFSNISGTARQKIINFILFFFWGGGGGRGRGRGRRGVMFLSVGYLRSVKPLL